MSIMLFKFSTTKVFILCPMENVGYDLWATMYILRPLVTVEKRVFLEYDAHMHTYKN